MGERRYTDDQAKEILRRAIGSEEGGAIAHDDLIAAAEEVGISREAVEEAVAEVEVKGEVTRMVLRRRTRQRRRFWRSFGFFLVVNAFLFGIDYLTAGGPWFHWPLLGWGLVTALSALKVFFPDDERDHREAAKALSRRKAQEEREKRKRERKRKNRDLEDVIEDGVEMFLGAIAGGVKAAIDTSTAAAGTDNSEFQRYVDERRSGDRSDRGARNSRGGRRRKDSTPPTGTRRRRDSTPPTGVRVESADVEEPEEVETEGRSRRKRR